MVWFQVGCCCRALFPTTSASYWRQNGRSVWFRHTHLCSYVAGPTKPRRMLASVGQPQEILLLEPHLLPQHQCQPLVESKLQQQTLQPRSIQEQYQQQEQRQPQQELQLQLQQPDKENIKRRTQHGIQSEIMDVKKPKSKSTVLQCLASTSGSSAFREMDNYFNGKFQFRESTLAFQEAGFLGASKGIELIQKKKIGKQKRKLGGSALPMTNVKGTTTMLHREIRKFIRDAPAMSHKGTGNDALGTEGAKNFLRKYIVMLDKFPSNVSNTVLRLAISKDIHLLQELFNRLVGTNEANAATYESYLIGLIKCKKPDEALQVYKDMSSNNMNGSLHMYNMLLSSVCDDVTKEDSEKWDLALSIMNEIRRVNVRPNTATFNSLMYLAYQQEKGAPALCLSLFSEMRCRGCKPTLRMLHYLFRSMYEKHTQSSRKRGVFIIYLYGLLNDLEAGNIVVTANHPDDFQFFTQAMHISCANKNVKVAQRLMNFVLENDLVHGLHVRFFHDYMRALMLPESPLSLDDVFAQYKRLVPQYYKIDGFGFKRLLSFFGGADGGIKYIPELYADIVSLNMMYFDSVVGALLASMNCKLPQNGRLHLLEIAEHALSNNKQRDSYPDTEQAVSGLLYLYCLCDVGEDKIVAWLDYCENQYGMCRSQLATSVFRTCLTYEEFGGATRAMQVILQDNMRSNPHTVKLLGSSYMQWRLDRFRSDVMVPMDLTLPASTDSMGPMDTFNSVAMQTFRTQFIDTIHKCQVTL